jgi:hypothetical protein
MKVQELHREYLGTQDDDLMFTARRFDYGDREYFSYKKEGQHSYFAYSSMKGFKNAIKRAYENGAVKHPDYYYK